MKGIGEVGDKGAPIGGLNAFSGRCGVIVELPKPKVLGVLVIIVVACVVVAVVVIDRELDKSSVLSDKHS